MCWKENAIKRYFSPNSSFCCGTFLHKCLCFENILKFNTNILTINIALSKYHFIYLSKYWSQNRLCDESIKVTLRKNHYKSNKKLISLISGITECPASPGRRSKSLHEPECEKKLQLGSFGKVKATHNILTN